VTDWRDQQTLTYYHWQRLHGEVAVPEGVSIIDHLKLDHLKLRIDALSRHSMKPGSLVRFHCVDGKTYRAVVQSRNMEDTGSAWDALIVFHRQPPDCMPFPKEPGKVGLPEYLRVFAYELEIVPALELLAEVAP